jgi:hypothetical protein
MKWPWVSRALYDREVSAHHEATVLMTQWATMWRETMDKYHALKLQGAVIPEPTAAPAAIVHPPADPVREKIREQVRANPGMAGLGGYLSDYARELRDQRNWSPAQIVDALGKWESSEDQSAAVDSVVPVPDDEIAEVIG